MGAPDYGYSCVHFFLNDGHPYLTVEEAIEIDTAASYLVH